MSAPRLEWALADALEQSGCSVCRIVRDAEEQSWEFFFYDRFQEPDALREIRGALGYCERHLAQLLARRDAFVAAAAARAAVDGALEALGAPRLRGILARRHPAGLPRPGGRCPVCAEMARLERSAVAALARVVQDDDGAQKLQASDGLCFDHLGLASDLHDLGADRLRTRAEARLREVRDALQGFWESFDYRKGDPGERDAAASTTAFRLLRDDPGRAT